VCKGGGKMKQYKDAQGFVYQDFYTQSRIKNQVLPFRNFSSLKYSRVEKTVLHKKLKDIARNFENKIREYTIRKKEEPFFKYIERYLSQCIHKYQVKTFLAHVKTIDLSNIPIPKDEIKKLCYLLLQFPNLKYLDLSNTQLNNTQLHTLLLFLAQKKLPIEVLKLQHNHIQILGAKSIGTYMTKSETLTELDISSNSIGKRGIKFIANHLERNPSVLSLNLSNNSIEDEGITLLMTSLKQNSKLQNLRLSRNMITNRGVIDIFRYLEHENAVQELDLSQNLIEDLGILILAKRLKKNILLKKLDLSANFMSTQTVPYRLRTIISDCIIFNVQRLKILIV